LFVFVRTGVAGPPTAVKRISAPSFPLEFSIGPGDRIIEGMPFDGPFQVTARLDADGSVTTREAGDLVGTVVESVSPGAKGIAITLDQVE
jgi:hypothetical protein